MTSEEILGITPPPEHQCSTINGFIREAEDVQKRANDGLKEEDVEPLHDLLSDVDWEMERMKDNFEELREVIEDLRTWGQMWKELAKDLIEKYDPEVLEGISE